MKLATSLGVVLVSLAAVPAEAFAWGYEGHRVVALIAQGYLTPGVKAKVDALLAADTDTLAAHNMVEAATWADTYRNSHRETSAWHFVDIELSKPDVKAACFGYPAPAKPASAGPAQDCLIDRTNAFLAELSDPAVPQAERIIALKFVLHFMGDLHQPLHTSDNEDRGGNCVLLSLGGPRAANLHSYWDTATVTELGADPVALAASLRTTINAREAAKWEMGDPASWAQESYAVAKAVAYWPGAAPGCPTGPVPVALPPGYGAAAQKAVALQLQKAGVRLAFVLNRALS